MASFLGSGLQLPTGCKLNKLITWHKLPFVIIISCGNKFPQSNACQVVRAMYVWHELLHVPSLLLHHLTASSTDIVTCSMSLSLRYVAQDAGW